MNKFDKYINQKMKLYEAGVVPTTNNPMVPKKPQLNTNPPDTGSGMGAPKNQQVANQPQAATPTQATQQTQTGQTNQATQAPQQAQAGNLQNMLQQIMQQANTPEGKKVIDQFLQQYQNPNQTNQ
jgi:hypothetical protein